MATISNTPRPGYVWDATDNVWYPIGTGPHSHADYITSSSAINPNIVDAKGDIIAATAADTVARLAVGSNDQVLTADSSTATGLKWATPASTTFPTFRAYRGTDQNLSSGVWTKVQLNTESWDTANNFDSTTNYRFTPTTAGYYQINALAYVYSSGGTNGNYMMSIYKNGSQYATWMDIDQTGAQNGISTIIYFNGSTDYIEMYARGTSSGTNVVSAGPVDNYMDGVGIRS